MAGIFLGMNIFNSNSSAARAAVPMDPAFCYSTREWIPFPGFSGYCPDGESPFDGPGPSYGGGNHRWPDGSDD